MNTKNEPEFEEQNVPELCGSRRLLLEEVTLEGEIEEVDGILNFYLACWFDVDQVFGTHVETTENDDWINVYANYDMASGKVCDELEIAACVRRSGCGTPLGRWERRVLYLQIG